MVEVTGNQRLGVDSQNLLHGFAGNSSLGNDFVNFFNSSFAASDEAQVNQRNVGSRNTYRHTVELALQCRNNQTNSRRSASSGWDHVQSGSTGTV